MAACKKPKAFCCKRELLVFQDIYGRYAYLFRIIRPFFLHFFNKGWIWLKVFKSSMMLLA